jgi:hypothetical protein
MKDRKASGSDSIPAKILKLDSSKAADMPCSKKFSRVKYFLRSGKKEQ